MIRLFALLGFLAAPVSAQSVADTALIARDNLIAVGDRLQQAGDARDRVAALTETVLAYETGLSALRAGIRQAALREQALTAELNDQRGEIAQLLGVLQTIRHTPAPVMMLHPDGPTGTARAGMIVADVTPALQSKVDTLRLQLDELHALRQAQDSSAQTLRDGLQGARQARTALTAAISNRTDLPTRFADDPVQTALLIASSETMDQFATGLAQVGPDLGDLPDASTLRGTLLLPVQGRVTAQAPGMIIATKPGALVTLPADATLRFKGALLDYDMVAIIEPAAGVLMTLAGMKQVFGTPGEVLPQGSPLGLMAGNDEILTNSASNTSTQVKETLYIEIRENRATVNPADWFGQD